MNTVNYQPFNVFGKAKGVFPPVAQAQVPLPKDSTSYHLLTNEEHGPQHIPFWHENTCHPETVITLDGEYTIMVGGEKLHQKRGDVLVIPTGVKHGDVHTQTGYRNLQIENNHAGCKNPPLDIQA